MIADPEAMRPWRWHPYLTRISDNLRTLMVIRCREPINPFKKGLSGSGYGIKPLSTHHSGS